MYAVIISGGKQYRVSQGDTLAVDRIDAEVGATVDLDQILMVGGQDTDLKVGTPVVGGAVVKAQVVEHMLGKKREAYKYQRRQRSRVTRGSRPRLTSLTITEISA